MPPAMMYSALASSIVALDTNGGRVLIHAQLRRAHRVHTYVVETHAPLWWVHTLALHCRQFVERLQMLTEPDAEATSGSTTVPTWSKSPGAGAALLA